MGRARPAISRLAGRSDRRSRGVPVSRVQDLFDLSDRVAVLTGVGSGIGKATATMLSAAGATIVGGDIDEAGAQATADEIKADGGTAIVQRVDVTKRADVDALVDLAASRARPGRHHGQHRRRPAQQARRRVHRRGVRAHPRDQPEERLLRMPGRDPAHDPAGLGQHRQHRVGRDRHARADARVLRHDEGRGHDAHQDARDRSRSARHPRRTRSRRG